MTIWCCNNRRLSNSGAGQIPVRQSLPVSGTVREGPRQMRMATGRFPCRQWTLEAPMNSQCRTLKMSSVLSTFWWARSGWAQASPTCNGRSLAPPMPRRRSLRVIKTAFACLPLSTKRPQRHKLMSTDAGWLPIRIIPVIFPRLATISAVISIRNWIVQWDSSIAVGVVPGLKHGWAGPRSADLPWRHFCLRRRL